MASPKNKPSVASSTNNLALIDLFAGCGGLSLGLERAGFRPIFVNELNADARETYLVNRDHQYPLLRDKFQSADIVELLCADTAMDDLLDGFRRHYGIRVGRDVDLVAGGPPCQGFSSVGLRRSYGVDKRQVPANHLYRQMASFVAKVQPRAFLFENVEGLLRSKWTKDGTQGEVFEDVLETFRSLSGYSVKYKLVHSKDYGVPQNRPRLFIVGFRADVFAGTAGDDAVTGGFLPSGGKSYPDLIDVLGDLVDPDFEYGGRTSRYAMPPRSEFQQRMRTDSRPVPIFERVRLDDHEYSNHSEKIQNKFKYMLENAGRIHPAHKTKKFRQRVLPKHWGDAGPTITITSLPDDYVHYEQARSLTVRECARIQTFPDWYRFRGPRTTGGLRRAGNPIEKNYARELPKYTQIANAVPVDLAEAVGTHLFNILAGRK